MALDRQTALPPPLALGNPAVIALASMHPPRRDPHVKENTTPSPCLQHTESRFSQLALQQTHPKKNTNGVEAQFKMQDSRLFYCSACQ